MKILDILERLYAFFEFQQISSNDCSNFKVSKLHHRNTADVEPTYVYIGFTAA